MDEFLRVATSFPTAVYTVLLSVVTVHWLLSALGILEIDTLDGLLPDNIGTDGLHGAHGAHAHHAHHAHDGHGTEHGGMSGLLMKFGLHGVPIMVVITIIAIVGWASCYFFDLYVLSPAKLGALGVIADIATAFGGLLLSIPIARMVLSPVRRMLRRFEPVSQRPLLGRYAEVRSAEVTKTHGQVWLDDGGAGLILQVRAETSGQFVRGDRVVLIEYLEQQNAYRVITGEEFERL
ncbi:MAG: hypothetical protein V4673_19380 [Pseudomonadota bacterium]